MAAADRQALLQLIAATVADYRQGEIPAISPAHVDRWASQFDAADQLTILEEVDALLRKYYVSRSIARDFVRGLLTNANIIGADLAAGVKQTHFLRVSRKGSSQNELLAVVDELLQELFGLRTQACGADPTQYLYLDDCLFSGNTAWHDLHPWLPHATTGTKLNVVFFAMHSYGLRYLRNNLDAETNARSITTSYWGVHQIKNRPWETQAYECLWPRIIAGDPHVDA
jgi:hypothetical protein